MWNVDGGVVLNSSGLPDKAIAPAAKEATGRADRSFRKYAYLSKQAPTLALFVGRQLLDV